MSAQQTAAPAPREQALLDTGDCASVWTNDQWMPVLAVKPDGTQLFMGWYVIHPWLRKMVQHKSHGFIGRKTFFAPGSRADARAGCQR